MRKTEDQKRQAIRVMTHQAAIETSFTGTIYGEIFSDRAGDHFRQVFEYLRGFCTDAWITRVGHQL